MKEVQGCLNALQFITNDQLAGRTVLITGGGSGFGRQLAIMCATGGADVVIGDVNVEGMQGTEAMCKGKAGSCQHPGSPTDVTNETALTALFDFARETFSGPPDVVVVNAGISEIGNFTQDVVETNENGRYPAEPTMITLDVNLAGALLTAELAQQYWKAEPADRDRQIVLIASMGGHLGIPGGPLYSASKHGLVGYWTALCAKLRRTNSKEFSCHVVCPFFSFTGILSKAIHFALAGLSTVEPDTVAATVLHIVRDVKQADGPGLMFCLPDDKNPLQISDEEFGPLDKEFYGDLFGNIVARQKSFIDSDYTTSRTNDIFSALGIGKTNLAFLIAALTYGLWQISSIWRLLSPFSLVILGIIAAAGKDRMVAQKHKLS